MGVLPTVDPLTVSLPPNVLFGRPATLGGRASPGWAGRKTGSVAAGDKTLGLGWLGVSSAEVVGVVFVLSTRDFREDERGVTLAVKKAFAGVSESWDEGGLVAESASFGGAAARLGNVLDEVVALAASLGVIGGLEVLLEARVGFKGRP